ncbi:hypothetical protein CAEBREN_23788 [Caenorhabditis brenneri]|uniref:Uncharacterized protein n=1 Tax=Caenorhabditis brenneri TaxID=135651 RepID=G0NE47_CAEBE|nr:hypothetical protein CAEBREN_23788 [Caenorhabditis brenneri]
MDPLRLLAFLFILSNVLATGTETVTPDYNVEAYWVNISMNKTNGQYYWSDGVADTSINLKPKVTDPNGAGVFTTSRDPSVHGHGTLSVIPKTGEATPFVRAVICGGPG